MERVCSTCNKLLSIDEFSKNQWHCKPCASTFFKKWSSINPRTDYKQQKYQETKTTTLSKLNNRYKEDPEFRARMLEQKKQYRIKHRDKLNERTKQWKLNNKEKIRDYTNNKNQTDVLFNLTNRLRSRLHSALRQKGWKKSLNTIEVIGCTGVEFKNHIEKHFKDTMSWENRNLWEIDHVIPSSSSLDEKEVYELFHYTNLRPLWTKVNRSKNKKIGG